MFTSSLVKLILVWLLWELVKQSFHLTCLVNPLYIIEVWVDLYRRRPLNKATPAATPSTATAPSWRRPSTPATGHHARQSALRIALRVIELQKWSLSSKNKNKRQRGRFTFILFTFDCFQKLLRLMQHRQS